MKLFTIKKRKMRYSKAMLTILILQFVTASMFAQTTFLGDNWQEKAYPDIDNFVTLGSNTYWTTAEVNYYGDQKVVRLWKSDGTEAGTAAIGTALIDSINESYYTTLEITELKAYDGNVYFITTNGVLCKSDGTDAGTRVLKKFETIGSLTVANGLLFFNADDGIYGKELWKTDGTVSGTQLVKDIYVEFEPTKSSDPFIINSLDGYLIFLAETPDYGKELWRSDGTAAGTQMIKEINIGIGGISNSPSYSKEGIVVANVLYFPLNDGINGQELWKTDATADGTVMVKDINAGFQNSSPDKFFEMGGSVFFRATGSGKIWKTDGTEAGTISIDDNGAAVSGFASLNGNLYYGGINGLVKSNGNPGNTNTIKNDITVTAFVGAIGTKLYFFAKSTESEIEIEKGIELWQTDGSTVSRVLDLNISESKDAVESNNPPILLDGSKFYFAGNAGLGFKIFQSDGTSAGTSMLKDVSTTGNYKEVSGGFTFAMDSLEDNVIFPIRNVNRELWKSDGTLAGTSMIDEIATSFDYFAYPGKIYAFGESTAFPGFKSVYVTSGTPPAVTEIVASVQCEVFGAVHRPSGKLIFSSSNSLSEGLFTETANEPWVTDGTEAGTFRLKDIIPGGGNFGSSWPRNFFATDQYVYFTAGNDNLYKTDGTKTGTQLVTTIYNWYFFGGGTNIGDLAVFEMYSPAGSGLYKTDGTAAGTELVKDLSGVPDNLSSFENYVTFRKGGAWISDGTTDGTVQLTYGSSLTEISKFYRLGNLMYFVQDNKLYQSDGTMNGTSYILDKVVEILPFDNSLFIAQSSLFYRFNGDIESMVEVPGTSSFKDVEHLFQHGNHLFFYAYESATGHELYNYSIPTDPTIAVRFQNVHSGITNLRNGHQADDNLYGGPSPSLGEARLDESIVANKFIISNSGSSTLSLGTPTFSGAFADYFSFENYPQNIAPGTVDSFNIVFTGNSYDGIEIVEVQIPSNDPNLALLTFEVAATSYSKPVMRLLNHNPQLGPIDFGSSVLNQSKFDTISVYNFGKGNPLTFDSLVFSEPAKDEFSITVRNNSVKAGQYYTISTEDLGDSLAYNPDFTADLMLVFEPTVSGIRKADLTVYSSDPAYTGTVTFNLIGEAACMPADSISPATTDMLCSGSGEEVTLTYPLSANETYCWGTFDEWSRIGVEDNFLAPGLGTRKLSFDNNNLPVLAAIVANNVNVLKYENDAWSHLGMANIAPTTIQNIDVEIDASNTVYVSYVNTPRKASVKKYDGTDWISVGDDGFSDAQIDELSMSIQGGQPVVAYSDKSLFNRATVKRFNGTSWESVGDNGFTLASAIYPDVEVYNDEIYVAFMDGSTANSGASLYKFNGTSWEAIGQKGFSDDAVISSIDLMFDDNGMPYVAFGETSVDGYQGRFSVMKFEANNWVFEGNRRFSEQNAIDTEVKPTLVVTNNTPYLFYTLPTSVNIFTPTADEWGLLGKESLPSGIGLNYYFPGADIAKDNNGVLHCFYARYNYFNLIAYENSFTCLSTENTFTTSEPGFYKVLVTNTLSNCTANSLNTVEVRVKDCFPIFSVYGNGEEISIGDNTPSANDNTILGSTNLNVPLTKEFELRNSGDASLSFDTPITFSGTNASKFSVVNQPDAIPPGESYMLTVQYQSDIVEVAEATIEMETNYAINNGSYFFDLQAQTSGINLTLTDELLTDLNNNGYVDDGDVIRYTAVLTNETAAPPVPNLILYIGRSSNADASFVDGSLETTLGTIGGNAYNKNITFSSLNAGATVTIHYNMLINTAWPMYYSAVQNQITMYSDDILPIKSDDPDLAGDANPTETAYEPQCTNPSEAGVIGNAQTICSGATPDEITNVSLPTGEIGTLEYKWQHSTTNSTSGFSDLDNSNTIAYSPGALTSTTWFKRLAKADCMVDWSGALESNVIAITVPAVLPPSVSLQSTSAITTTESTANGTIDQTCTNATNRGAIWYSYTNSDKEIGGADVTNVAEDGDFTAEAFTASLTGMDVNTQYNVRAHASNPDGIAYSSRGDFWTLANVPAAPAVDGATATTLDVTVNVNSNPTTTEFCINETSTDKFVQIDGSLDIAAAWQTAADWSNITVSSLTTGVTYTFKVKARNGDGVETAYGNTAQGVPVSVPSLSTQAATEITATTATGNGTITNTNGNNATNRGLIWYAFTDTDKVIDEAEVTNVAEDGDFTAEAFTASFTGLDANTHYNARAHATNPNGTGYGDRVDFWTLANVPAAPTVDGATATTLDVTVNVNNNPTTTEFCINLKGLNKFVQADGTLDAAEIWQTTADWGTITVTGLTTGTIYRFKVKARNGDQVETVYGDITEGVPVASPSVSTEAASAIATTAATGNGTITNTNGNNATNRGLIWYPYTDTNKVIDEAEVTNVAEDGDFNAEAFTANFTGLDVNTHYNARAHATNPDGTAYGDRVDFWTLANVPAEPTVDGATATTLDVTVNVNSNPTTTEFCINETSTGKFVQIDGSLDIAAAWQKAADWSNVTVTGLTTGTTYTFQVKARNGDDVETAYSNSTQDVPVAAPAVSTQAASALMATSATGNGTITNTNGNNATNRGLIWYPYTDTDKVIDEAEVTNVAEDGDFNAEAFTANFTGLDVNTHYNARAHATNPYGTGYGARTDFWTLANVPSAPIVDGATATSLDVTVNENNNPNITEYCINESSTGKFVQTDGSLNTIEVWQTATSWSTITLNNLNTGDTYTFRVKARNGELVETVYSIEASGTTCQNPTDGGSIAAAQSICEGSFPDPFTSTSGATGYGGTLEYKWQQSTSSATTGFADINPLVATATYSPEALTTTTWFKRLSRVDCKADWTDATESNVVEITVEPTPVTGSLIKTPDVMDVCENDFVNAALTPGTGGNGVDELEYRTNDGSWSSWLTYNSGSDINTSGLITVEIRSRRMADNCSPADYVTVSWDVEATPISGSLAMTPDVMDVCENDFVNAALTPGTGGNGVDELEYRTNDGVWSSWLTYNSGSDISTSGLTTVEIRSRRMADNCSPADYVTVSWDVEATPFSGSLALTPDVMDVCENDFVNAALIPGTGGNGVDELEYRTNDGAWSSWLTYNSGSDISTSGLTTVEIRTRRMANQCDPDNYFTVSWDVEATPIAGTLVRVPDVSPICETTILAAVLMSGEGGNGADELEYRRFNQGWSAWQAYISGQDIQTTNQTAVEIRTRRMANHCDPSVYNVVSWEIQLKPRAYAGANNTICASSSYTMTDATASNYSNVQWTSSGDGYFGDPNVVQATYHPGYADANSGEVMLFLTADAISPCGGNISDMVILDIQQLPNADAGSNASICALDSYQLNGAASHYSSLVWASSGSGSFDDATALDPVYTPSATDISTGFVNLTLTAGSLAPCDAPDSDMMVLTIDPALEVSVSISSDETIVCDGIVVNFSAQTANAGDNPTYQWLVNGTAQGSNSSFSYVPTNGDQVQLQLSSSIYCVADATALSNTISLTVNPIPEVSVNISSDQTAVCEGTVVSFTATAINGGSSPSYQWYVNGNTAGSNSSSFSYAPADGDQVWAQLTSNIGCNEGATALSNSIQLQVNPTLEATVSISTNNTSLCSGSSASFTSTISNGGDNPQYQWTVNGVPVGNNSASFSYVPMNLDVVQLTLTSNAICVENSIVSSNSITLYVTQSIEASAVITVDDATVCEGDMAYFTANTANGGVAPVYVWFVNGQAQGSSQPTFSYVPQDGDLVHLLFFSNANCVSNSPVMSNLEEIEVGEYPSVSWNSFEPSTMCIFWAPVALSGAIPEGGTYSGEGVIDNMFYPELAGAGEHELTYAYSTALGCADSATFTVMVDVCTGLAEQNALTKVNLYPNPTRHQLHISFGETRVAIKQMMVVNMLGEVVKVYVSPEAKSYYTLDVFDLNPGTYLLKIITASGVENKAFIVRE